MIFNLLVFFSICLNGFPLRTVKMPTRLSLLDEGVYIHIHCIMCSVLNLMLSARVFYFYFCLFSPMLLCSQVGQHYLMSFVGENNIRQPKIQQTTDTQNIWIFCELTIADTFRLASTDGATTVSCFDLWHQGVSMFVKAIKKTCAGTDRNNKSQISR